MALRYNTPGVYRQEIVLEPTARLRTGVPGFIGFVQTAGPGFNTPVALHRQEEFATAFSNQPGSYLDPALRGFFANGGQHCYVVGATPGGNGVVALQQALAALTRLDDVDLVAIPDAMTLSPTQSLQVQQAVLAHCTTQGDRLALLDAWPHSAVGHVLEQRAQLMVGQAEPVNGALYYPWLRTVQNRLVPPCGHVAGIFARSDARVGVFKAPANEEVAGVVDLETAVDNSLQEQLNPQGINCIRAFPGRGIRLWGARTLSHDPTWRYINVRRLVLTLRRWIDRNMLWATFEPNEPRLWVRIQRELTTYLTTLLRAGALKGTTPAQAFYVKCDAETNPTTQRNIGHVVTEIGLAPLVPAEFIVVRIMHRGGDESP